MLVVLLITSDSSLLKYSVGFLGFSHFAEKIIDLVLSGLIVTSKSYVHASIHSGSLLSPASVILGSLTTSKREVLSAHKK